MERDIIGETMYRLRVKSHFDAAHKLVGYNGKCSELHGHTWKVEVLVTGEELDKIGMVVDFKILKEKLKEITEKLDYSLLNDLKEIGNPTSENLSRYIFKNLKNLPNVKLEKVRVWESPSSWCEYHE
jgi:6-pyruvoyltetrahydropterin/6-carboxytetrahydropterin synthase